MDYLQLLEDSYKIAGECFEGLIDTRFGYLSEYIFDFTTYDSGISDLFGRKALEVCWAISGRKTFEYIKDKENYKWYLIICNMPFFENKLEWGTSIRGAWWNLNEYTANFEIKTCGIFDDEGKQILNLSFNKKQWNEFVEAMYLFANQPRP